MMTDHEDFAILCALAATGQLTEPESRDLAAHCASCAECRRRLSYMAEIGCHLLTRKAAAHAVSLPRDAVQRFIDRATRGGVPLGGQHPTRLATFATPPNLLGMTMATSILLLLVLATPRHRKAGEIPLSTATVAAPEHLSLGRQFLPAPPKSDQRSLMPVPPKVRYRRAASAHAEPAVAFSRFVFYPPSSTPHDYAAIPAPRLSTFAVSFVSSGRPITLHLFDPAATPREPRIALLDRPQRYILGQFPEPEQHILSPHLSFQLP